MTTPRLRDALAVARINRIKARCARMQVMAAGQRTEDRLAAAMLEAAAEGMQMLRDAQRADEAETPPESLRAH